MLVALKAAWRLRAPLPGGSSVNILELEDETKTDVFTIDGDGIVTMAGGTTRVNWKEIQFDLSDFRSVNVSGAANTFNGDITTRTRYPFVQDDTLSKAIVWPRYHPLDKANFHQGSSDRGKGYYLTGDEYLGGMLSPIQVQFKIPADYRTAGTVRMIGHQYEGSRGADITATRIQLGYRFFITAPSEVGTGLHWDNSALNQSVFVGTAGNDLSPTEINFTMSASETAFSAGQWVTFQYWRIREEMVVDQFRHLLARFQYYPEY